MAVCLIAACGATARLHQTTWPGSLSSQGLAQLCTSTAPVGGIAHVKLDQSTTVTGTGTVSSPCELDVGPSVSLSLQGVQLTTARLVIRPVESGALGTLASRSVAIIDSVLQGRDSATSLVLELPGSLSITHSRLVYAAGIEATTTTLVDLESSDLEATGPRAPGILVVTDGQGTFSDDTFTSGNVATGGRAVLLGATCTMTQVVGALPRCTTPTPATPGAASP